MDGQHQVAVVRPQQAAMIATSSLGPLGTLAHFGGCSGAGSRLARQRGRTRGLAQDGLAGVRLPSHALTHLVLPRRTFLSSAR
jgi:hypothetical protein